VPIYEFYCEDCHTVFSFLSRSFDTERRPGCPKCERERLERQVSLFAISKGRGEGGDEDALGDDDMELPPGFDEEKMMRVMSSLERDMEGMDEDDPRQMAHLMRKLYDATGMDLGPGMHEAIRRMEAGEDPDAIEEELGDVLEAEGEGMFAGAGAGEGGAKAGGVKAGVRERLATIRKRLPPKVDPNLYPM
jgi:putative FmdB family regulatory protein